MSEFRAKLDPEAAPADTGIAFATWQDRQLAAILDRTAQLLRELRAHSDSGGRNEELSRELGRLTALLELRDAELRTLRSDAGYWQAQAMDLRKELKDQAALQAEDQRLRHELAELQDEVARLQAAEKNYSSENQSLSSMHNAAAFEAANLRRLTTELQNSLSWKITAPLRFLTKPLFQLLAPRTAAPPSGFVAPAATPQDGTAAAAGTGTAAGPLEKILPQLRRAQSIAIIPCAIPFSSTLNQRPISCARYLADHGTTVLYVAWQWSPDEVVPQAWEEVYPRVFHIPLFGFENNVQAIASASHARSFYLCTLPSPNLVEAARPLRAAGYHIHYDIMDDWEGFHAGGEAPWFSAGVEREMVNLADSITAVSDKLIEKFEHLRSDIVLVRNGYQPSALNCEQFIAARTPLEGRKIVGYFGHFSDAWFDWDAVIYAAQTLPGVDFELIGWAVSDATGKRLAQIPNIRLVGIVPQKELHRYARKWWLGIIPFQATQVSAAVDPLKIYEYLHLGLPSVVTGIPGIAGFPLVQFAEGREDFRAAIEKIEDRPGEQLLAEVAEFLKDCVWDERFAKLQSVIREPAGLASLYAR